MRLPKSSPKLRPKARQFKFDAIGTGWIIDIYQHIDDASSQRVLADIKQRVELFDRTYSRFRDDSWVTELSKKAGTYHLPPDAKKLLDFYVQLFELTDGKVTPLIGQALADAGYDAKYSLKPKAKLAAVPSWDEIIDYKFPELTLLRPALLDFGAAGKGYLVDIVSQLLTGNDIDWFCVDAGGDMFHSGRSGEKIDVGLEHPGDSSQVIGIVQLSNKSICGSAGNRRAWGDYTHILDPHTLKSPKKVRAAWVVDDSAMVADGLATCLSFVSASALQKHYTFEYAVVYEDYSFKISDNFPGKFFT